MKINKNQALYRALPSCWVTYSDSEKSDYKYACKVISWNTRRVEGINEEMIKNDISRRIESFKLAGGIVNDEFDIDSINGFEFVEPAIIENIPDIVCNINPSTYYCQRCNTVFYKHKSDSAPNCPTCRKNGKTNKMNQLQMVYACKCGFADGVKPQTSESLLYHWREKEHQFKFFTSSGKKREMEMQCPSCSKRLLPKNATDSRLFYAQSGNLVNLYNREFSDLLKQYKFDAEILMFAKWFNIISNDEFLNILKSKKEFFEYKVKNVDDPEVIAFANAFNKKTEEIVEMLNATLNDKMTIGKLKKEINKKIMLSNLGEKVKLINLNLLEFDILKYPKHLISLEDAIEKGKNLGYILDESDIYELINKMHIKNMQVSESVQIVNYAYGFTRLRNCPDGTPDTLDLRLRGFNNKVFTTLLDTEGILFEIDMKSIFKWLQENEFISIEIDLNTDDDYKKWFIENVNLDSINHFSDISEQGTNKLTKIIYSLIHTISHMIIISAGKNSGLSRDSISEIIFPCSCSFFIYPTTSEGVTLGSISGMFETNLEVFIKDAVQENEICTFDPICSTNQNGACVACAYLNEVNCTHFNKDLSRSYLYGGTIKFNNEEVLIKKGFWK